MTTDSAAGLLARALAYALAGVGLAGAVWLVAVGVYALLGDLLPCAHRHVTAMRRDDGTIGLRCVVCGAWRS